MYGGAIKKGSQGSLKSPRARASRADRLALARLYLIDLAAHPALRYREHNERDGVPPWPEAQVPGRHNTHEPKNNAHTAKNDRMLHRLLRREASCEPGSADADDDAIRGRQQGERVVDRLVYGREDTGCVQYDVDKGRDYDDDKHPRDHRPDGSLIHNLPPRLSISHGRVSWQAH